MHTRDIRSGTQEYPFPKDVIATLLKCLVDGKHVGGWAIFECSEHSDPIKKMFQGVLPFMEVALLEADVLELDFGLQTKIHDPNQYCASKGMPLPDDWDVYGGACRIHVSNILNLPIWMQTYFIRVHGCPSGFQLQGTLEGLREGLSKAV